MSFIVNDTPASSGGAVTAAAIAAAITDATDAELVKDALSPATAYDGSSSTGFTASNGGSNRAASIATNRFNLSITAGELGAVGGPPTAAHPRIYRDLSALLTGAREDWSVIARVAIHSLGGRLVLAVGTAADGAGAFVAVAANGTVTFTGSWGSGADVSTGAAALPVDGTGWLIIFSRGGELGGGFGTGTSTDPPSRWSRLTDGGNRARVGAMARVTMYASDDSGVGVTGALDDLRVTDGR